MQGYNISEDIAGLLASFHIKSVKNNICFSKSSETKFSGILARHLKLLLSVEIAGELLSLIE